MVWCLGICNLGASGYRFAGVGFRSAGFGSSEPVEHFKKALFLVAEVLHFVTFWDNTILIDYRTESLRFFVLMNSLQWLGCATRVLQLSMQVGLSLLGLIGFEAHEDWPQGFRLS